MPDSFELEIVVAAEPERVFSTWLDAKEHAAFTGGGEAIVEPWSGGRFTAWDGYIHGILLGVDQGKRIVQTWRTSEFPPEYRDSRVVIEFEPARGGTRVRVKHGELPPSQVKKYEKGWMEHYLKPLARYFAKGGKAGAAKSPPPRALATAWGRREERKRRGAARKATAPKPAARKSKAPRRAAPRKKPAKKRARR
ncbi:MAG: SRPBCC domain-containing protein [Myxococcales bacterium]|nr:SRPBCC domain-containing protein [Myxococcales bacterium]